MKLGIDTRILKSRDLYSSLEIISNYFRAVEICASHIKAELNRGLSLSEIAQKVYSRCRDLGVEVVQVHAPYGELDEVLSRPDKREQGLKIVLEYIEFCSKIGCPVLVMHVPLRRPAFLESFIRLQEELREATRYVMRCLDPVLRRYGVKIAFENRLEQVFGMCPVDIVKLIVEEGVENFGICLDTGHANVNKLDIPGIIRELGRYIIATHLHDNDGSQDRHAPPLTGTVPWLEVIRAFKQCCPNVPLVLEVEVPESCSENVLLLCKLVMEYLVSTV